MWVGWGGLNPSLVSALAPFGLDRAGAEIGPRLTISLRYLIIGLDTLVLC